jgi:hypothetical protein
LLREKDLIIDKKNELIEKSENELALLQNEFENAKIEFNQKIDTIVRENLELKEKCFQVKLERQAKDDELHRLN